MVVHSSNFRSLKYRLSHYVYRLDTLLTGVWSDLDEELLLWECDRSGWFCRVIYAQEYDDTMLPTLTTDRKRTR